LFLISQHPIDTLVDTRVRTLGRRPRYSGGYSRMTTKLSEELPAEDSEFNAGGRDICSSARCCMIADAEGVHVGAVAHELFVRNNIAIEHVVEGSSLV